MIEDIMNNVTVDKLYNDHKDMLTSCNISYKRNDILGLCIKQEEASQYYFFSKKCSKTLDKLTTLNKKDIDKIISDVLDSLIVLHNTEYYHGDIKAQNIMLCPSNRNSKYIYKIIDWGRLYPIYRFNKDYKYGGSMQAGSPLGFYFMIRNKSKNIISRDIAAKMALLLFEGKLPLSRLKSQLLLNPSIKKGFNKLWSEIKNNFIKCVNSSSNDEELFNKYKYTLDTYNFALTLLYVILNSTNDKNKYNKYFTIIRKMTLYNKDMILNAHDALSQFKLLF
jgi:serine/threonine protein kinase